MAAFVLNIEHRDMATVCRRVIQPGKQVASCAGTHLDHSAQKKATLGQVLAHTFLRLEGFLPVSCHFQSCLGPLCPSSKSVNLLRLSFVLVLFFEIGLT